MTAPISYSSIGHDFCYDAEQRSFWFRHRNKIILAAVTRYPPNGTILDVGAGNGFVSQALQQHWETIAIEPGSSGADHARSRGVRNVICATLDQSGLAGGSAGAIGVFDVVEHTRDDVEFLRSLSPYLKPLGRIYITVPAYQALWSGEDVHAGHFRRYSRSAIAEVCRRAGLEVEFSSYFFSILPPAIFVVRVLPEKLRLVQPRDEPSSVRQHDLGGSRLREMAERFFTPEVMMIARGRSIPFGASCIVVARKLLGSTEAAR